MFASVIINSKGAKSLKDGHPWVMERDLESRRFAQAGIVGVLDWRRNFLGQAFYSPTSKIALRFITASKNPIDLEFFVRAIELAFRRRKKLFDSTNAVRVLFAESDHLPSVVVDLFNDVAAVQITSAGAETVKAEIIEAVKIVLKPRAIIEKNATTSRQVEGLPRLERLVYGESAVTQINEGGLSFEVDVLHGQKTGAYLDYRPFRFKSAEFAKGRCLDIFCYQGWLACHLARAGAKEVIAVDASRSAISAAEKNAKLNNLKKINFVESDAFEFLNKLAANGDKKFDFIHIDPPPFAKNFKTRASAMHGYEKLLAMSLPLVKKGGVLMISACSHYVSEGMLERTTLDVAQSLAKKVSVVYRGVQDADHPILKNFPESLYLKAVTVKVK